MRTPFFLSIAVLAAALVAGCSSDDDHDHGTSGGPPATGCAADTRKDVYEPGLSRAAGSLDVKLVESRPGPPIKGTNAMTIEILDEGGEPVDGATVTVTPWMPDHAHGSAVKPVVTAAGSGRYEIDKIYLAMAGLWQIKVSVQRAGATALEEATFQFCLDG